MKPEHVQQGPDCWVPEAMVGHEGRRVSWGLSGIARVRDDGSLERARAEMNGIASQLEREYPDDNRDKTIRLVPLREAVVGDVRPQLRVFAAAVAFVLLIACANVANLLLVRAPGRRRELATRSALGASRWRLVRQLLTETMLLSAVACAVGLLFAHWSMAALIAVAPPRLPRLNEVALDGVALFFSVIVSLATGVVCGLVPALQSSRTDINDALKDEGPTTMGRRRRWLSNALIVAETALALVLLIGAGLMTRTFVTLHGVDPGFRSDHVLTVGFNQSLRNFNMAAGRRFYRELIGRVQALPGVDAAAVGSVPIARDTGSAFWVEGRPDKLDCAFSPVTDQFFRVFGIRLMEGRTFAAIDTTDATPVAVLSRSLARQLWPNASAIGKRIAFSDPATERTVAWASIVGVVDDTRNDGLEKTPRPQAYVPLWQNRMIDPNNMVVRTAGNPRDLLPAIRTVVREIDKDRALARVATLDDRIAELVAPRRFNLFVIGVFSMLAFVLAIVGVYAVVSHTVAIRTREIGTRMVLGADRVTIFRLVARQSLSLILLGEVMGLTTALGVNRLMKMMVFGVTTTDASTYATTACVFAAIALLASYVPARRATRIDPMTALRCE
jgi:putative ABC transport system permease protein